ncbi:response regulator transcription factor [Marinomonas sp. IMCC 4694]|uniref:response regulator transcription factor n=1 Tax=Marinomonas sp. IMCC 4694 TaxID=2605432 RepID=UPI0011E7AAF1|nr:response regulator transcription factor [Marinomonas sp. IMCC 4694]TYL46589.1 response regulator transcription factor [Marinomonas sp. IMCC 4694]
MRVLLVEDTQGLGEAVRDQISDDGHAVDWVHTLHFASANLKTTDYSLVLLDLMLPDGNGLDFLKKLRGTGNTTPVIVLTARDQVSDRIEGLNAGADDYLIKPFDLSELSARVAAVARRYRKDPNPFIKMGEIEVDLNAHRLKVNHQFVELTGREWALFEGFLQRPGALLSRSQLEDRLYQFGAEIESNTIEVYISRLRKKLGRNTIVTVRNMGYRLAIYER